MPIRLILNILNFRFRMFINFIVDQTYYMGGNLVNLANENISLILTWIAETSL
jgi:hypothetical protein